MLFPAMRPPSPKHALIGGLIGFGLGAALGVKGNQDQHAGAAAGAAVLVGLFGGVIGTAIGAAVPDSGGRPFRSRHRTYPDGDDYPDEAVAVVDSASK